MRFGDEDQDVSIATNSSSILQFAEEEEEDEFENAPLGKWVPSSSIFAGYADFICQSQVPDWVG